MLAERFAGSGGTVRWTNFLAVGGRFVGIHVENAETTLLRQIVANGHRFAPQVAICHVALALLE